VVEVECERKAIDLRVVAHETAHETVEVEVRTTRDENDAMRCSREWDFDARREANEETNALRIVVLTTL